MLSCNGFRVEFKIVEFVDIGNFFCIIDDEIFYVVNCNYFYFFDVFVGKKSFLELIFCIYVVVFVYVYFYVVFIFCCKFVCGIFIFLWVRKVNFYNLDISRFCNGWIC